MRLFPLNFGIGLVLSNVVFVVSGQAENPESAVLRLADKEDVQIEARILSISSDRRMLRIERNDGQMFEIEIVKLSLDSQQDVKDWLTAQPGTSESIKIEMTAHRSHGASSREKLEGPSRRAIWEQERLGYRVEVTNRTAEEAGNLTLEYCLLLQEKVSVRSPADLTEDNPVRWRIRSGGEIRYLRGSVELPRIRVNGEELIDTATMSYDSVRVSGGPKETGEDEPIGIVARVIDGHGRTVGELSELRHDFPEIGWKDLEAQFDPQEAAGAGMLVERIALN